MGDGQAEAMKERPVVVGAPQKEKSPSPPVEEEPRIERGGYHVHLGTRSKVVWFERGPVVTAGETRAGNESLCGSGAEWDRTEEIKMLKLLRR